MRRCFKRMGRKVKRGDKQITKTVSGGINVAGSSIRKISRLTKHFMFKKYLKV